MDSNGPTTSREHMESNEETPLECVEHNVGLNPRLAIIWLHGLGADGHDFEPIVDELRLGFDARFVFPHAPVRPITVNGGMPMRAWFDIRGFSPDASWDEHGIGVGMKSIRRLVDREIDRGIPSERIVLAGFSQGGALALHTGLRESRRLCGMMALSSFLPLETRLGDEKHPANERTPIFMAHGDADGVIDIGMAQLGKRRLESDGYPVDWRVYPMAHSVCAAELTDVADWLRGRAAD